MSRAPTPSPPYGSPFPPTSPSPSPLPSPSPTWLPSPASPTASPLSIITSASSGKPGTHKIANGYFSPREAIVRAQASPRQSPRLASIPEHVRSPRGSQESFNSSIAGSRPSSINSVTFRLSPNPKGASSTAGRPKRHRRVRIRNSSPPKPSRFKHHVSFDNFSGAEPTESNAVSFTLNVKHMGYQYKKRSRTFMVGIDENDYSDMALKWMLDELVDDGDEIVCVRVIDPDARVTSEKSLEKKQYQDEAQHLMCKIQGTNDENRAISIVLEYAVGKLHTTFQKMIQLYEPAMLVVGTKGRPLGGFQGLMGNRNSFSKWCLQQSPIPVVVVRPNDKREKKKLKRTQDPTRNTYRAILEESGVTEHETTVRPGGSFARSGVLPTLDQDEEAYAVARALGITGDLNDGTQRDPFGLPLKRVTSGTSRAASESPDDVSPTRRSSSDFDSKAAPKPAASRSIPKTVTSPPNLRPKFDANASIRLTSPLGSDEDELEDSEVDEDDETEFEVTEGQKHLLGILPVRGGGTAKAGKSKGDLEREKESAEMREVRKERLHAMEVGEAKALAAKRLGATGKGTLAFGRQGSASSIGSLGSVGSQAGRKCSVRTVCTLEDGEGGGAALERMVSIDSVVSGRSEGSEASEGSEQHVEGR